jgi:hypothetical protein
VFAARQVMPIGAAVRLFCIASLALIFIGTRLVNRAIGGPESRIYRVTPLLCYGGPFQFGFLSFCFGIGLALLLFGVYLRLRDARLRWLIVLFLPAGFALLISHLAAFGLFGIAVGAYELAAVRTLRAAVRRFARAACFLGPPFVIFLALSPAAAGTHAIRWSGLRERAEAIAALTLFASPAAELTILVLAAIGFAAALATGVVRIKRETVAIAGAMALAFVVAPRTALGGGYIDYRLPWAESFFVLAALAPGPNPAIWPKLWFATLATARIALIAMLWLSWEPVLAGIDAALRRLPPGARLLTIEADTGSTSADRSPPLVQTGAYAAAYRQAFVPSLFASVPGFILHYQPEYRRLAPSPIPTALGEPDPAYTHVLALRMTLPGTPIASGRDFALYALDRK